MNMQRWQEFNTGEARANEVGAVNPHLLDAPRAMGPRAYMNFPGVNWAWAASNASFDWMD